MSSLTLEEKATERPFTASELETLPLMHDARKNPNLIVTRQIIKQIEIPPLLRISNRVGVIFQSELPQTLDEKN